MKRMIITLAALAVSVAALAQAQINTKKVQIGDFTEKVTKVVFSGNMFLDSELENAVKDCWRISPYEFCSMEDFKALKGESDYYFLLPVSTRFRKEVEPGLMMLTLLKGGKGADKSLDKMLEIVSVPLCSVDNPSGREMTFLPAIVDIIQNHAAASMEKDSAGYGGLRVNTKNIADAYNMKIYFAESDLGVDPEVLKTEVLEAKGVYVVADEDADAVMQEMPENTLVSFSVYPDAAEVNSYCYNMLIDASTHKLYYFRKYKITKTNGPGFLKEDLQKILK